MLQETEINKLKKEFNKAHSEYSLKVHGKWADNWRQSLKHADLKEGYWYWKGIKLSDLLNK